jgi:hypothetical protein
MFQSADSEVPTMGRVPRFVTKVDLLGMLDIDLVSEIYLVYTMFRELAPISLH